MPLDLVADAPAPLPASWRFPADVRGWLTPEEGGCLARYAAGRTVLEVGTYCGRSAVCMAQTAAAVFCVDPFDSRATPETGDTLAEFRANMARLAPAGSWAFYCGILAEAVVNCPVVRAGGFGMAFIDGDHSPEAVASDVNMVLPLLRPEAVLALHDCEDRGPRAQVGRLASEGWRVLATAHSLVVMGRP